MAADILMGKVFGLGAKDGGSEVTRLVIGGGAKMASEQIFRHGKTLAARGKTAVDQAWSKKWVGGRFLIPNLGGEKKNMKKKKKKEGLQAALPY
jgi:hypothetical protein